jgi:hypothetical protein
VVFRTLPTAVVFSLILTSGAVPGLWTGRWVPSAVLEEGAARLSSIPPTAGDWDSQALEVDPRQLEVARASGHLHRRYVDRRSGRAVVVLLLCGPPGPISVHTPDVCFRGAGYEEVAAPARYTAPGDADAQFWVRRFQKQAAVPVPVRVLYGWSTWGAWEAPDHPRWTFASRPVLYKLYLIRELARKDEALDETDPALDLLRALLPQLRSALAPDPERAP